MLYQNLRRKRKNFLWEIFKFIFFTFVHRKLYSLSLLLFQGLIIMTGVFYLHFSAVKCLDSMDFREFSIRRKFVIDVNGIRTMPKIAPRTSSRMRMKNFFSLLSMYIKQNFTHKKYRSFHFHKNFNIPLYFRRRW